MILASLLVLSLASPTRPQSSIPAPAAELTFPLTTAVSTNLNEMIEPVLHSLLDPAFYFGAGVLFGSATLLGGAVWAICQLSPWASTLGNECLVSSRIFGTVSIHSFAQMLGTSPFFSFFFKKVPSSHSAWETNTKSLSQIPVISPEDNHLISFLQKRWLAKNTGCYPFLVNWMCPTFGISFQVHPESTNSYARDPATKFSDTYKNRVEAWKQYLPHPKHFPLVLTRPSSINDHLPSCFQIAENEEIQSFLEGLARAMRTNHSPVIIDLTSLLPKETLDRKRWLDVWEIYENQLSKLSAEHHLDLNRMICIQRVEQKDIGGIRMLPFRSSSLEKTEEQHQFLLEWISRFGLTANRIELDRSLFSSDDSSFKQSLSNFNLIAPESKEQWLSDLDFIENSWKSDHLQKTLMLRGTLEVLKGLCKSLSEEKWMAILNSPTRSCIVQLFFAKIKEQLHLLLQEDAQVSFHETASRIEQIHADLASLLEIFTPFTPEDFPEIYRNHLSSIPEDLKPLTGYALHASAMTSLGSIFRAVEKTIRRPPCVLFGENAYFENIHVAERVSKAVSVQEATEEDWKEVDLLLVQFNPTVKRINFKVTEYQATEYHVEKVATILHRALKAKEGKPLCLALDCTLDFSDSERVGKLLKEFQKEIKEGGLNILCYRSGLKFDLFGMDNYCGAPFCMVHNHDEKWSFFDSLLTDPALQTDRLSLNWFCLAYEHASPYLEGYRKHIFDNTRAVLNKIPERLYSTKNPYYRVIPVAPDADPSFIDIKIFGPLHAIRGGLLVGVFLTIKCMEAGHPLLYRPGIGFYHPNLAVLFGKECTTVRLTVGLDPSQVDTIVRCMDKINACNGSLKELKL